MISLIRAERTEYATSPAVSGYTGQGDTGAGLIACPGIPTTIVAGVGWWEPTGSLPESCNITLKK